MHEFKDDFQVERGRFFLELIIRKNPDQANEIGKDEEMYSVLYGFDSMLLEIVREDVEAMIEAARESAREAERKVRVRSIKTLARTAGFTVEQAMDALQIPADEREKYAALIAGEEYD